MKNNYILTGLVALLIGIASFFAGMKYQESKVSPRPDNLQARQGRMDRQGRSANFRPVTGEVISLDDKTITVKMQDGSSKIVLLPEYVTINKTDSGSKADLKTGVKVGIFGTENSDGTVTAQNIQLNPMFRGMMQGGFEKSSPSSSPK